MEIALVGVSAALCIAWDFVVSIVIAAVAAGLHTGQAAPRYLGPRHRLAEEQNWRTIELLLEGGDFLRAGWHPADAGLPAGPRLPAR